MKLECIPIENPQEGFLWESCRACDDVHVEERVTIEISHPSVQPLVEVLNMISKAPEQLDVDIRQIQMSIEHSVPLLARFGTKNSINAGGVNEEVVKVKEHIND